MTALPNPMRAQALRASLPASVSACLERFFLRTTSPRSDADAHWPVGGFLRTGALSDA